eukprot:sb/3467465/
MQNAGTVETTPSFQNAQNEKIMWTEQKTVQEIAASIEECVLERVGDDRRHVLQCKREMFRQCVRDVCRVSLDPPVFRYQLRNKNNNENNKDINKHPANSDDVVSTKNQQSSVSMTTADEDQGEADSVFSFATSCSSVIDNRLDRLNLQTNIFDRLPLHQVLYIDYGNRETLPLTELYPLASQFTVLPGLALHCSLFDIVPQSVEGDWSEGCLEAFYSMTENMRFFLVMKQPSEGESDIKQVDLRGKEIPSVRDFLVFLEHAKHSTPPAPSTPSTPFKAIQPRVRTQVNNQLELVI